MNQSYAAPDTKQANTLFSHVTSRNKKVLDEHGNEQRLERNEIDSIYARAIAASIDVTKRGQAAHHIYDENGEVREPVQGPELADWQEFMRLGMVELPGGRAAVKLNAFFSVSEKLKGHDVVLRAAPQGAKDARCSRFNKDYVVYCEKAKKSLDDNAKWVGVLKRTASEKVYRLDEIDYVILSEEERGEAKPDALSVQKLLEQCYMSDVPNALALLAPLVLESTESATVEQADVLLRELVDQRKRVKQLEEELRQLAPPKKRSRTTQ